MRRRTLSQNKEYQYDIFAVYNVTAGTPITLFGYKFDTSQIEYLAFGDLKYIEDSMVDPDWDDYFPLNPIYTIPTTYTPKSTGQICVYIKLRDLEYYDLSYMFYAIDSVYIFQSVDVRKKIEVSNTSYMCAASSIYSISINMELGHADSFKCMFYNAKSIGSIVFYNDVNPDADNTNMFSLMKSSGVFYYPKEDTDVASHYSEMISMLPSGWSVANV